MRLSRLHPFRGKSFHPQALVNLSLIQSEFRVAVTLISVKLLLPPTPSALMHASYLNSIYLLGMAGNTSCSRDATRTGINIKGLFYISGMRGIEG